MNKFSTWSSPFRAAKHQAYAWTGQGMPFLDARPSWEQLGLIQGPSVVSVREGFPCGPRTAYADFHPIPNHFCQPNGVVGKIDPRFAWFGL